MKKGFIRTLGPLAVMFITAIPLLLLGHSAGPPDGYTGAPGEGNCGNCHYSTPGDMRMSISGNFQNYLTNMNYTLTITIRDSLQSRWGFELTAVGSNGYAAGTLSIIDPTTTQLTDNPDSSKDYVKQTVDGTYDNISNGPVSWQVGWLSPSTNIGPVAFYASGVAADGGGTATNDYAYSVAKTAGLAPGCCDLPGDVNNDGIVNILDPVFIIRFLYKGGPAPPCRAEAQVYGIAEINILEVTRLLAYLYKGYGAPICGPDI